MTTKPINATIKKLEKLKLLCSTERDDVDPEFEACEVSLAELCQVGEPRLMSRTMTCDDDKTCIIELPSGDHDGFCGLLDSAILRATGTLDDHLQLRGPSCVKSLRELEPDFSFDPTRGIGAIRLGGMTWINYHALKVEVSVSRV